VSAFRFLTALPSRVIQRRRNSAAAAAAAGFNIVRRHRRANHLSIVHWQLDIRHFEESKVHHIPMSLFDAKE